MFNAEMVQHKLSNMKPMSPSLFCSLYSFGFHPYKYSYKTNFYSVSLHLTQRVDRVRVTYLLNTVLGVRAMSHYTNTTLHYYKTLLPV